MDYQSAWRFLDDLQFFKVKLGLDSMNAFLESTGNPQKDLRFVHVAGTNGKGSVSVTLLELLAGAGYKIGLYTSPHLSCVRERFRINERYISEDEFARHAQKIIKTLNRRQITYFEFTTTLALLWFADQQVDLAILEVGLGGRLDATNVITPLVGVITNVSMDHEAYLGNTLEEVASEKAGIIKSGVALVSGAVEDVSREVIRQTCAQKEAPLYFLGRDFHVSPGEDEKFSYQAIDKENLLENLQVNLKGRHQKNNTALALASLELLKDHGFNVSEEIIRKMLLKIHWPGRCEYLTLDAKGRLVAETEKTQTDWRRYLLDGAHNPDGIKVLREVLERDFSYRRLVLVWASMSDKDIGKTLEGIAPLADHFIFTMPESERSATPEQLAAKLPVGCSASVTLAKTVEEALHLARHESSVADLICIAGSLYLIGRTRQLLLGELV